MSDSPLAPTQVEALAFIDACCRDMVPIAALSGAAGTGKSVTLATATSQRESLGDRVIRISNFVAGPLSLHRVIAHSLGVADAGELSVDELEPVLRRALAATGRHEPPILAMDDAQSLLPETLRYLCLLAGLRDGGRPLFRIMLVGRPGFTLRQPITVQATLDVMTSEAARQKAERLLTAQGVAASDDAVREIVQHAQGNLRRLDNLVRACADEVRSSGRKRLSFDMVQVAAGARTQTRKPPSRLRLRGWMALPALLVVLVAAYGVIRHEGGASHPDQLATSSPAMPEAAAPGAMTPAPATPAPAVVNPAVATTAPAAAPPPAILPIPAGAPAPVTAQAGPPAPPGETTQASGSSSGFDHRPAIVTETLPPPTAAAPGQPVASVPPTAPAPAASPAPVASLPVTAAPLPAAPLSAALAPAPNLTRYRLYNVGACHHGVCPRWAVLDLDRQSRSFAGFNPTRLGLPPDTVQRLREGSLDLIVEGRLADGDAGGRRLDAVRLVSIQPHHGRAAQPAPEEQPPAAPDAQSPPPGYLQAPQGAIRLAPP